MSSFFESIEPRRLKIQSSLKQHALKGQKLLAQGIALGKTSDNWGVDYFSEE